MKRPEFLPLAWKGSLAALLLAGTAAFAQVEIADDFSLENRGPGAPLKDSQAGKTDVLWSVTGGAVLRGEGSDGWIGFQDSGSVLATVPVPESGNRIRVEARLHPTQAGGSPSWLAIGLGNPSRAPLNISWGEGIMLLVNSAGTYVCMVNPSAEDRTKAVGIKGGSAPHFDSEGWNTVAIEYDRHDKSVSMWVNEEQVLDRFDLSTQTFTPAPGLAGFSGYSQITDQKSVDDFKLTVTP